MFKYSLTAVSLVINLIRIMLIKRFYNFNTLLEARNSKISNLYVANVTPSKICKLVEKIASNLGINSCLVKSIVKFQYLFHLNKEPKLIVSVKLDSEIHSHAWVDCSGVNTLDEVDAEMNDILVLS
tara:strand:- start:3702 stop:4079 length:378 start_codon:yes stop_codon:yes gene_type:complete